MPRLLPSRRPLAGLALLLACTCLAPAALADDDFEDPKARVRLLYRKFRADLAGDQQLKRCEDEALRNYAMAHLGEFISLNTLVSDIGFKQSADRLNDMPEERQKKLEGELARHIVNDNFAAFKLACAAGKLQIASSAVDFTVSQVDTHLYRRGKRPLPVDIMLVRGWDKWLVSNIYVGQSSLTDKYRALLGPAIAIGGYEGMLNKLINLNM